MTKTRLSGRALHDFFEVVDRPAAPVLDVPGMQDSRADQHIDPAGVAARGQCLFGGLVHLFSNVLVPHIRHFASVAKL